MYKFIIGITPLLIFANSIYSQASRKDFNKDGVIDQVTVSKDGGSAFSSKNIIYQDGKTKKKVEFSVSYSLGSFFAICNAPDILGKSGRELLGNQLFGLKDTIDPSLNWLIDACGNKIDTKELGITDFATKYTPVWVNGEPKIPAAYYSILSNSTYKKLVSAIEVGGDSKSDYCWIDYQPYPHKSMVNGMKSVDKADFIILKIDSTSWLYRTTHGVIIRRHDKYSWVFINDNQIFEANEKLRWPSIEENARVVGDYILIIQKIRETGNLFVVDPSKGFVVRLSNDLIGLSSVEKIEVNKGNNNVELSDSGTGKYSLTYKAITEIFQKLF